MHAHRHKTWAEAAGLLETSARLGRLPDGLAFPEEFPEPIRFDARGRRLVYRGFMSSVSYAFLRGRSQDVAYLNALDYLYQASACAASGAVRKGRALWRWALAGACLAATAGAAWV